MSEEWQENKNIFLSDYPNVAVHPHIQAGRLIRDIEALYGVKFGELGTALVIQHYDKVYAHFWKLLEKAELKAADKK